MKTRNVRQRRDRQVPCVMAMRAKRELRLPHADNDARSPRKVPKNVPSYGVVKEPSKSLTEDDISILRHKALMTSELKKKAPNPRLLEEAMRLTFYDRRRLIITENATVARVAETYPALFNPNQVRGVDVERYYRKHDIKHLNCYSRWSNLIKPILCPQLYSVVFT